MALTIDAETTETISLDEYVDFIESRADDLQDPDAAIATACRLKALANNKRFLARHLNDEMKSLETFQERNDFKPSTLILRRGLGYNVRAVVWLPIDQTANPGIFSYFEPHDHNFDFLTCGYYGPGYKTTIYRYDHAAVVGYTGERVALEYIEDTALPEGKLMYYYSSRDVHIQLPPESLSISLNLVLPRKQRPLNAQYEFAIDAGGNGTIISRFGDMQMRRLLFAAVKHAGDDNSVDILWQIATGHADPRTRALAWETLVECDPANAEACLRAASDDGSRYVKELARRAFDRRATASTTSP